LGGTEVANERSTGTGIENERSAGTSSLMVFHLENWYDQERRKNKARETAAMEVRHRRRVLSLCLNLKKNNLGSSLMAPVSG
jgi:hypothetical protein